MRQETVLQPEYICANSFPFPFLWVRLPWQWSTNIRLHRLQTLLKKIIVNCSDTDFQGTDFFKDRRG